MNDENMHGHPVPLDRPVCCVCGLAKPVYCCPLMTGDRFDGPTKHPVCRACVLEWGGHT